MIRVDNGSVFILVNYIVVCKNNGIMLVFIQYRKPMQNAYGFTSLDLIEEAFENNA